MNGLSTAGFGDLDDLVGTQVAFTARGRAQQEGFIGHGNMTCMTVCFRVDGNTTDAQAVGGLNHSAGDLATVCNQYFIEHGRPPCRDRLYVLRTSACDLASPPVACAT